MANRARVRWGTLGGIDLVLEDRATVHLSAWAATIVAAQLEHAAREGTEPEVEIRDRGTLIGSLTRGRARELAVDLERMAAVERMMHPKSEGRG